MDRKYILNYCPNYYNIVNFNYSDSDIITAKIISIYRSYIFSLKYLDNKILNKVKELDMVVAKYLDDYYFKSELMKKFPVLEFVTDEDIVNKMVNNILDIYDKYLEGTTRKIYISKWI